MPNYVPGEGSLSPKLMIVGEAPGKVEDLMKRPFVGPTGELLNEMLFKAGISRNDCYLTNVVKYQPPFNDFTKLHLIDVNLEEQIKYLWEMEIDKFKPNCILAVGDRALNAICGVSGILNYRGSILRAVNGSQKVVATVHPAALYSRGSAEGLPWVYKVLIQHDIDRAAKQSSFPHFSLPDRSLVVAQSSLDVYRFFQEYKSCKKATNDIESINCIPVCTGFAFNKHHAISIPLLTKVGSNKLTDMSKGEILECWKLIQESFDRFGMIGHNYKYDEYKQRLFGFRNIRCVSDTRLKVHTIFPELPLKALHVCSSLWTEEPFYKEEGKEEKVGGKAWNVERYFRYNARDCAVTYEVDENMEESLVEMADRLNLPLKEFFYTYVMRKHSFYLHLENNGFNVDQTKKAMLKGLYTLLQEVAHDKVSALVGREINVKSNPEKYELLYKELKFPIPRQTPTGEDALVAHLANHCKGKDAQKKKLILESILEETRIRDQISRAIDFKEDFDGRCKTSFNITGTETARTSTNILKKPVRPRKIGLGFHTIPKHGRLAKDIRGMFIPDPGFIFIQGDLSQAEPRIVAVLCEDWELLEAFNNKVDIHRRTAGMFFGYTPGVLNLNPEFIPKVDELEKDGPERYTGKTFRNAGNYDMGKRTAMVNYNTNAQKYEINTSISEWKAGVYIDQFHKASPKIRGIFHKEVQECINSKRLLVNPYGRPREFFGRFDHEIYKEAYAQIPQSTVSDTVQLGGMNCWDEWGHDSRIAFFVSENHDALVAQVPENDWMIYARSLKKHMERLIDFEPFCSLKRDFKLLIPADIEVSLDSNGRVTSYGELNKASKVMKGWDIAA